MSEEAVPFKSGFVNIVGNPNVGKSTIMNYLVGERLSIVTSKSQTTRHRILGIATDEHRQIVYSDTPGVVKPGYKLQERMRAFSNEALIDADVLLYVTDVVEQSQKNSDYLDKVRMLECPVIVVINKIDLTTPEQLVSLVESWHELLPAAEIIPLSALNHFGLKELKRRIEELIPEAPAYFDKEQITDRPARFFVSEIIREKALLYYAEEIPYAVEVVVEEFIETKHRIDIRAIIYVERESQKGILIGHKGVAIKKLGTAARRPLEQFFGKHIRLELIVRVEKDWRTSDKQLDKLGYTLE